MKLHYQLGNLEDLDTIMTVVTSAVTNMRAHGNYQWGEAYPLRSHFYKDIEEKCLYKAIDEEGQIVAIASMNIEQSEEYKSVTWGSLEPAFVLHRLIIHPRHQKQGIGKAFVDFYENKALELGFSYLRLDAYSLNAGANKLYLGNGYLKRGEVYFRGLKDHFNCYEKFIGTDAVIRERLGNQMTFIREADRMKSIYRQTMVMDKSRQENDAEHSWHLALMALLLNEHSNDCVDLLKVIKMVLIHDIVEIDAGDTFVYDEVASMDKAQREQKAALRLFGMLPEDQKNQMIDLWEEFEQRETPEARFAASLDRLQPMLNNFYTDGASWKKHNIKKEQVINKNGHIVEGSKGLWHFAQNLLEEAIDREYLKKD